MGRLKTEAAKKSLLRRVRRQRLKYVTVLPSLITILNGVCGFASIVLASKGFYAGAAYMIVLAMIADMLDGRLARMTHSTSSFGGQLDSLCDVVSFCIAPAFLVLTIVEAKLKGSGFAGYDFLQRFIWLAAAAYCSCGMIRLARFNVENEEDESSHMSFMGLPSPAAAGVPVSLVIFHQEIVLDELATASSGVYGFLDNAMIYALPFLLLGSGFLMISRIRYPHMLNQYLKGKKPFAHLIRVLLFLGLIILSKQAALVVIFCGFAGGSFFKWCYVRLLRKSEPILNGAGDAAASEVEQ